ncbi:MAG: hypothetical protein CMM58_03560 [Rhodospirillaceae bacterium]|nr:hypothetical protein [Rhodospirillaceae bacterium]|tara:strand:- start:1942 stop:2325 length:384 start_codon:yes stop_codon:yes gene_type:complete
MATKNLAPGFLKNPQNLMVFHGPSTGLEIVVDQKVIARTKSPIILEEGGYPLIYYIPRKDVRMYLLKKTNQTTYCPFKGTATYWMLKKSDSLSTDIAWSCETTYLEAKSIETCLSFHILNTIERNFF